MNDLPMDDVDARHGGSAAALEAWRRRGTLLAPLPRHLGGLGYGTEPAGAEGAMALLRATGRNSLSLGRLLEGHINALQLVARYGTPDLLAQAARDVKDGHLFAIWNTEAPPGVRLVDLQLRGRKSNCSAIGLATRAVITVDQQHDGGRMLLVRLTGRQRHGPLAAQLHGMRETHMGWIDFDGYVPAPQDWIGASGDYLRQPLFSAGAWRALAVMLGGLDTMADQLCRQLRARRRDGDANQRARVAGVLTARETVRLWVCNCAVLADGSNYTAAGLEAYVNLARRAVEAASLEALQLTQRSLGLAAFVDSNPVEPLMRDLATYLRQPAMDEGLDDAAAWALAGTDTTRLGT